MLPNDAANVFITLSARNLNPQLEIIARGETRSEAQFLVVAIHREDGQNIVHPRPDTVIQAKDRLIFVCHRGAVVDFTRSKRLRRSVQYRGASRHR